MQASISADADISPLYLLAWILVWPIKTCNQCRAAYLSQARNSLPLEHFLSMIIYLGRVVSITVLACWEMPSFRSL